MCRRGFLWAGEGQRVGGKTHRFCSVVVPWDTKRWFYGHPRGQDRTLGTEALVFVKAAYVSCDVRTESHQTLSVWIVRMQAVNTET